MEKGFLLVSSPSTDTSRVGSAAPFFYTTSDGEKVSDELEAESSEGAVAGASKKTGLMRFTSLETLECYFQRLWVVGQP